MILLQLICDRCKKVVLEKPGSNLLEQEKFPMTDDEIKMMTKDHYGHECHIEPVEKEDDQPQQQ